MIADILGSSLNDTTGRFLLERCLETLGNWSFISSSSISSSIIVSEGDCWLYRDMDRGGDNVFWIFSGKVNDENPLESESFESRS